MNFRRLFALASLVFSLADCSHSVRPYSEKREKARAEERDVEQTAVQLAYADGNQAGQSDRANGEPDNYHRHSPLYTPATEKAYADGYHEGYRPAGSASEPVRDEGYNQGYDIGLRDRGRRKPSDPDAHIGEYEPSNRVAFERGYADGYNH